MAKTKNAAKKGEILRKIEIARKIAKNIQQMDNEHSFYSFPIRLKDAADRYELSLNDVIVKRSRWHTAMQKMSECEKQLNKLLLEAGVKEKKDFRKNKKEN